MSLPPSMRMANAPQWLQRMAQTYASLPEFVREDLVEGLLVGGGIALPVAMLPNQEQHERVATVLGGITAATLGGAASRGIGASIGRRVAPKPLQQGSYGYNIGRVMGRENVFSSMGDMLGSQAVPVITGTEAGRAAGRMIGDEVFGIAGTLGALAAARAMSTSGEEQSKPEIGEIVAGTVPGAAIGLATSGLAGGLIDSVGLQRALMEEMEMGMGSGGVPTMDLLRQHSVFRKRPKA
jgi:hypothetical protein